MRAAVIRSFGGPDVIDIIETALPEPGTGQLRIRVAAAAVNPVDGATRAGYMGTAGLGEEREHLGLGWDVAGTVDAVGPGVKRFALGAAVVGLSAGGFAHSLKAYADFVVTDAAAVAEAPRTVDPVHAATLPLNALTAAQALDRLALRTGDTVLVIGAGGAVGGYAVQLGRHWGLQVIGLASEADEELVRGLGAGLFVARGSEPGAAVRALVPGGVDGVLDTAMVSDAALGALRDGGAYATVRPDAVPDAVRGIRVESVEVAPDGARLAELAALVDKGVLTTRVAETYPLAEAAKAHARLAEGGLRGRIVLVP